ncbi:MULTISPECIES: flavin reductase family protein [unclassified Nocardia]|uniref:flavin reductase family protein n=1 Tax=unclassified Nocardia TaxID=2637762 RepID=UPI001CE43797|nr:MULTISPECIES: flavin reductase family protein [unclassified Nocardia]
MNVPSQQLSAIAPDIGAAGNVDIGDALFRAYCRKLSSGVTLVTSNGAAGWAGTTVSSVTSVSVTPPIVLCCMSLTSSTVAAIRHSRRFAVNLLAADQSEIADRFARPAGETARFAGLDGRFRESHGAPVLENALAVGWCEVHALHEIGDRMVVYGHLFAAEVGAGAPLIWHDRAYREIAAVGGAR